MTSLNVTLPDDLKAFADAEASRAGYADATEYVRALLRDAQQQRARAELEAELVNGLQSPAAEVTADDFDRMRREFEQRYAQRNGGGAGR